MPPSSAAARSLAFAVIGVGAASFAAHGQNVTAFNPYTGTGLPGGPIPQYAAQDAAATVNANPTAGPAFNPWSSRGQMPAAQPGSRPPAVASAQSSGATLPPPPPGPIRSRIVAVPELTTNGSKPRDVQKASIAAVAPKPSANPAPVAATVAPAPTSSPIAKPAPVPVPPSKPAAAPAATPAVPPPVAAAPTPPPVAPAPQAQMAALAPAPSPPLAPPARSAVAVTVVFTAKSTELSDTSKAELDRLAKDITDRTLRQVELRTVADTADPDSRKISLARALIVRNYLMDKGVRSKIEIASIVGDGGERVEILVPKT